MEQNLNMYDIIAKHYSELFPLDEDRINFITNSIPQAYSTVLDVGWVKKETERIQFKVMGMLQLKEMEKKFGTIVCFGNTLPHLTNL